MKIARRTRVCVCKCARFEKRHQLYRVYYTHKYIYRYRTYAYNVCASGRGPKPPPDESLPKLHSCCCCCCRRRRRCCTWTGESQLALLRTIFYNTYHVLHRIILALYSVCVCVSGKKNIKVPACRSS